MEKPAYFKANNIWVTDLRSKAIASPRAIDVFWGEDTDSRVTPSFVWR